MKLKYKLMLSYVTIVALVICIGVISFQTAHTINNSFDTVTTKTVPTLITLGEVKVAFLRIGTETMSLALLAGEHHNLSDSKDTQSHQQEEGLEREELDQALKALDQGINQYERLADNSEKLTLAKTFRGYGTVLQQKGENFMELRLHQTDSAELLREKEGFERIERSFFAEINKAIASELANLKAGNQLAHHTANNALAINLIAIFIFVVLTSFIGIIIMNTVASPILLLNEAALKVAQGQLDIQVAVNSNDEIGKLSQAFNYMVEQLRNLYSSLETARLQAETANHAKSQFLAHISHELRTPLNGILGYTQILSRDHTLSEKQRQGINVIGRSGEYLLGLINDVLDWSKIEATKIELVPTNFNLNWLIQGVIDLFQKRIQQQKIEFNYQPAPSLLTTVIEADEKRLRQILINLIGNAVKFTENGKVTLTVEVLAEENPVEISTSNPSLAKDWRPVKIRFVITDSGIGIAPNDLAKIFLPFERVGEHYRYEGTGLGLPITKKLVELMGGTIQVNSTPGLGSSFEFTLVLSEVTTTMSAVLSPKPTVIAGVEGTTRRILVVDDYWENRSVLVNLLTPLGFEIHEASNGKEGIQQAQLCNPDLVITNLTMPLMDGLELIRHLRNSNQFKQIPIIVVSASVFEIDQRKSFEAGGNAFLPKPVMVNDLLRVLQQQLHLNWIYEEDSTPMESVASEDQLIGYTALNSESVKLSAEQVTSLLNLIAMGDFAGIVEYAEEIEQAAPEFLPLSRKICQLAKEFNEKEIAELVEQYK